MTSRIVVLVPVLATALLLGGCNESSVPQAPSARSVETPADTPPSEDAGNAVAMINGTPISPELFDSFRRKRLMTQPRQGSVTNDDETLDELVTLVLLSQDAQAQGIEARKEVQAQLTLARLGLLAQAALAEQLKANPPSEEQIKAAYEERFADGSNKEYKARHILLKTEEDAKAVIAELDKGANFPELAKARSTGPSGPSGGDLGWFDPKQMVAPFSEAAAAMAKGSHSETPVKTQFGWHVILLEDSRDAQPPAFEKVRGQLARVIQQQRAEEYLNGLKAKAKIETKKEAPAS